MMTTDGHRKELQGGVRIHRRKNEGVCWGYDIYAVEHKPYGDFYRMVGTLIHYTRWAFERRGERWGVCDWTRMHVPGPGEGQKGGKTFGFATFAEVETFLADYEWNF